MKHIFKEGKSLYGPTLLLLHGTGGTEQDLLPLAEIVDPDANILSVRGSVSENGMPRFFKRLAEGVFDEEDLLLRTKELYEFIDEAAEEYGFDRNYVIAVGYSNGANIAGSLLFHYQDVLNGAVLHHPMVPKRGVELPDLSGVKVLITAGHNDPLCTEQESIDLEKILAENGAEVQVHWENNGHQLTRTEVEAAKEWYQNKIV
ncbi:alpha/beta hydrolase [Gracilibacillus massiliensis]|uniref:alpha/beta hydrolase n=1 Tax=Gracilibacillus massiliensis TaxID=1564956 RepID=UPI00071DF62C|nr:alpha/beta hydrolase [Gracilibacillus massiliensis]